MHDQSPSPRVIVSAITDSLRGFQRRRGERRSCAPEAFGGTPAATAYATTGPTPAPRSPAHPGEQVEDMSPFRCGFVEMNGRAIPVMDPVFLQALQAQVAQGTVPPTFLLADLMSGRVPGTTTADLQADAAVRGATNPEHMPESPPTEATTSPGDQTPPRTPEVADRSPEVSRAPAGERILVQIERLFERRADDEATRLAALHREHEARLAHQAEAAAKQQAALLREVLDAHRAELSEQAGRHTQVVRDLLREHQCQLDERTMAAVTREAQAIGTLLREHRDALTEANEAHRRGLEEILEHHQCVLQAAHDAQSGDGKLHPFLAEQVKLQREAFTSGLASLSAKVEQFGLAVRQLAEEAGAHRPDLSWLPRPSFVPPLPELPSAPTPTAMAPSAPPTIPESSRLPLVPPELLADETQPASTTSPTLAIELVMPSKRPHPSSEHDSVRELMDEVESDDESDIDTNDDDEMPPRLGPLTPLSAHP